MKTLLCTIALCGAWVSASEARGYDCLLHQTCTAAEQPCDTGALRLSLRQEQDGWTASAPPDVSARFAAVGNAGSDLLNLVSADIDTDAGAAALLTISSQGEALMTIHGDFFGSPGRITLDGACTEENR